MGIQINGQTDTITAIDGGLNVSGADLGSASAGSLNVTGIVTASGFSGNITGNVLGNVTGNLTGNVNASGVSTFTNGPVFIGTGTSTGTASQPLQVTGGTYVSGNLGIGSTNPGAKLHLIGNQYLQGGNYFTDTTSGYFWAGNGSFAGGIYGSNSGNVTTIISPQTINLVTSNTQRVTIDTSGRVTMPSQPRGFFTGNQNNYTSQNANGEIPFNTTLHGNATISNGRFTCPVAGDYFVSVYTLVQTATTFEFHIAKNGSRVTRCYTQNDRSVSGTCIITCAANDFISVLAQTNSFYLNTIDTYTGMTIVLLG